ncbi:lamin tail domain-containing protein [Leucobacter weissii]|uniref:Lamin tail domain-containing protein n=1 Tax=Leucobacter weissii TaxID=1983706 RepID=A0A939MTX8_9MICO|nr:lamin tail domain-containing protein [Leucobacter weissii]MBO1902914.1 lamin tail domain-containing protein [Leucobacter weissii]
MSLASALRPFRTSVAALVAGSLVLSGLVAGASPALAETEPAPPLVITEIMPDNAGTPGDQDYYEFFEVTNTTDADIDFADYQLRYHNAAWLSVVEPGTSTALDQVTIPANGTAVFWLRYAVGTGESAVTQWQLSEQDFRGHFGDAESSYPLFHVIGQSGFSNSDTRALRIFDGTRTDIVSESHYTRPTTNKGKSDHFTLPATGAVLTDSVADDPTPGTVDPSQLVRPTTQEPEPEKVLGNSGNASAISPLVITEINGDNVGADNWEFLEVTNTTDSAIDLDAEGISIRYHTSKWNAGTVQPRIHLEGENDSPAVIPAGGIAVFWMNYGEGDARRGLSKAEFRSFYGIDADTLVYRFGNQAGFANGGDRGFSLTDESGTITRAWVPADDGNSSTPWNAQFGVPDLIGSADARLLAHTHGSEVAPTPGGIAIEQVTSALDRPTDPELDAPLLQITELAPDTANVSGSDAYEFVEVYNASDAPVSWGDYTLNYLYTDNDLTSPVATSSTLWPSVPADPVIQPGKTLVLWVKNPTVVSAGLTVADFNTAFGTDLALGTDIVEMYNGGMANGGSRGIQVQTNTGYDISRAYYFADDQTTPTTAIQYAWNPGAGGHLWSPTPADGTVQTMTKLAPPTPGAVSDDQVSRGLVPAFPAGSAPEITDLTGSTEIPETEGLELGFDVTDDLLVRSVRLELTDNLGATETRSLVRSGTDRYTFSVPAVDLLGKRWIEYTVTASDGAQTSTLGPVRVDLIEGEPEPLRIGLAEGQFVRGDTRVAATTSGDPSDLSLAIDGQSVADPVPSLEASPVFAFEATATDAFFRNGVKLGDDVLTIFDEGFYSRIETVDAEVPVDRVVRGQELTLTVVAGTKAWPQADPNENNDDFSAMNFRLALPDGRVLHPTSCATTKEAGGAETAPAPYTCPADPTTRVGFSDAGLVSLLLTFTVPDDAFDSLATVWDTAAVADGEHAVTATAGSETVARSVRVDNTAPALSSGIEQGKTYRGAFDITAEASDAGSGVASVSASLDGEPLALPHSTSSLRLTPGEHELVLTAKDEIGNETTETIVFKTAAEQPSAELVSPADGASAAADAVTLRAKVDSPESDLLDVSFREGHTFVPTDAEIEVSTGTVNDAKDAERDGATALSAAELEELVGTDGVDVEVSSDTELPYQLFTVAVPSDAGDGAQVRVAWEGSANADARIVLYARSSDGSWKEVDRHLTTGGADTEFGLEALLPAEGYAVNGELTFLVQHSSGFAGESATTRGSSVTPYHPDATPRTDYDFTIAWESDTQYYNRNEGFLAGTGGSDKFYQHQLNIHDFLRTERDALNLQYLMHTGDIVDGSKQDHQWQNADAAYRILDDIGLPYGVLAGNHDVDGAAADYTEYGQYFGEERFAANPWYGGSYKNNRGHYDLISANGLDLLVLYMGWPDNVSKTELNTEDIEWMNSVIRQYPERKVWINLHEYMLTTGGLGPFPQRVFDEVVATNPNVFAVGSGHYHDAYTRTDDFDDDGDGTADRTVYSMLFDYQALAEGGQGFLRLLHFDNEDERILVRTYSPSLGVFNSDNAALNDPPGHQEFEIPYAEVGLDPKTKTLAADSFRADVLTAKEIASQQNVPSGTTVEAKWADPKPGERGWYVVTSGPHGGEDYSAVRLLTVTEPEPETPAKAKTSLSAKNASVAYGKSVRLTVGVKGATSGKIQLRKGTKTLGSGTIRGGKAVITLPAKKLAVGKHTLTARFGGSTTAEASSTTLRLSVAKARPRITVKAPASIKAGKRAKIRVTVKAPSGVPLSGKVRVSVGGTSKTVTLKKGKAVVTSSKLKRGKRTVKAVYQGSKFLGTAATSKRLVVRKR